MLSRRTVSDYNRMQREEKNHLKSKEKTFQITQAESSKLKEPMISPNEQRREQRKNIKLMALSVQSTFEKSCCISQDKSGCQSKISQNFAMTSVEAVNGSTSKTNFNTTQSNHEKYHSEKIRIYDSQGLVEKEKWLQYFFRDCDTDSQHSECSSNFWEENDENIENLPDFLKEIDFDVFSREDDDRASIQSNCSTEAPNPDDIYFEFEIVSVTKLVIHSQ